MNEPIIGVPGGEFLPDTVYSQIMAEALPWTIKRYGIDKLHERRIQGRGAVVVVVDTGVDANHIDLFGNVDLLNSRSFVPGQPLADVNGHGTFCSGIVAAINQGVGTMGVAPEATVIACKGLSNQGSGSGTDLANAITSAASLPGHKIFSLSFGASGEDPRIRDAILYALSKGHWVNAAAGNSGANSINYPGAMPGVVCVAALNSEDGVAIFSSSNESVDVGFGGVAILSTLPNGKYAEYNGTSMATPGIAGLQALAVGELIRLGLRIPNQETMMKALFSSCLDVGTPGRDNGAGHGLPIPEKFLTAMIGVGTTPPPGSTAAISGTLLIDSTGRVTGFTPVD